MTFMKLPFSMLGGIGGRGHEGVEEYRKGIVFTPLTISIIVTPWLKKALALVDQMSSPESNVEGDVDVEFEPDDGMRRLVVEALGDTEHKELFSDYVALKNESHILSELRNLMLGVTVRHSRGSFTVNLDEGERSGNFWNINLDVGDRPAITVAEFSRMEVSVIGMQLRLSNQWELTNVSSLFDFDTNTWALWFMQFQANSYLKFYMAIRFNWAALSEEEVTDILEDFSSKMMNALGFRENNMAPNAETDAFPPTFEANVVGICWDLSLAKYRLKMAGLWEEE